MNLYRRTFTQKKLVNREFGDSGSYGPRTMSGSLRLGYSWLTTTHTARRRLSTRSRNILREVAENQKGTDRRTKHTEQLLKRQSQETDRQTRETDRRLRKLDEMFNGPWRNLIESWRGNTIQNFQGS